jgi:hypothetical protein
MNITQDKAERTTVVLAAALQIAATAERRSDGTAEVSWHLIELLRDRFEDLGIEVDPLREILRNFSKEAGIQ